MMVNDLGQKLVPFLGKSLHELKQTFSLLNYFPVIETTQNAKIYTGNVFDRNIGIDKWSLSLVVEKHGTTSRNNERQGLW